MNKDIELERIPLSCLETFPFRLHLFEMIQTVLQRHGVTVECSEERCVMTFPENTYKSELLPRIRNPQYEVHLPDGYSFYETTNGNGTLSVVRFRVDEFDQEAHEQFLQDWTHN